MWFLVVYAATQTAANQKAISEAMANMTYRTNTICMEAGKQRTAALASVGIHGRYLCMYHDEPDSEMARMPVANF